jgi:hypothetical protein
MPDTVNVGGIKAPKKPTLIIGGGVLVIGAAFYYRQKKASDAASQAAVVSQSGANTGIDPATGYAYGSAEDAAALSNQGQYISPMDSSSFTGGQVIGYDGSGSPIYGPTSGITTGQPGGFTNNAQWAQYVESYLEQTEGADPTTVGNAIGKYITGQPVTADMIAVINNAIAIGGQPPVAGVNGNPPHYVTSTSGTTTTTPPVQVAVPNCIGLLAGAAHNKIVAAGLVPTADPGQKATQKVYATEPGSGVKVTPGSRVTISAK